MRRSSAFGGSGALREPDGLRDRPEMPCSNEKSPPDRSGQAQFSNHQSYVCSPVAPAAIATASTRAAACPAATPVTTSTVTPIPVIDDRSGVIDARAIEPAISAVATVSAIRPVVAVAASPTVTPVTAPTAVAAITTDAAAVDAPAKTTSPIAPETTSAEPSVAAPATPNVGYQSSAQISIDCADGFGHDARSSYRARLGRHRKSKQANRKRSGKRDRMSP